MNLLVIHSYFFITIPCNAIFFKFIIWETYSIFKSNQIEYRKILILVINGNTSKFLIFIFNKKPNGWDLKKNRICRNRNRKSIQWKNIWEASWGESVFNDSYDWIIWKVRMYKISIYSSSFQSRLLITLKSYRVMIVDIVAKNYKI